jgi:gamma-glutamylcyclotransferase (GGCT)/AIG2-like uncharacterized protein YtfP
MLLATYGTFRRGEALSDYLGYLRMHGTTEVIEVTGLKLFVLGMAPGAKITGDQNDKAVVELIDADITEDQVDTILELLDHIEGVDQGMYERGYIDTPKGEALIYTKCGNVEGCVEITDWMKWQKKDHREKEKALQKAFTHSQAIYV